MKSLGLDSLAGSLDLAALIYEARRRRLHAQGQEGFGCRLPHPQHPEVRAAPLTWENPSTSLLTGTRSHPPPFAAWGIKMGKKSLNVCIAALVSAQCSVSPLPLAQDPAAAAPGVLRRDGAVLPLRRHLPALPGSLRGVKKPITCLPPKSIAVSGLLCCNYSCCHVRPRSSASRGEVRALPLTRSRAETSPAGTTAHSPRPPVPAERRDDFSSSAARASV